MRALSQGPGTLRGARPHPRAHACAGRGFPACAPGQSRSGACARYLQRTEVAWVPSAPGSRPPPPPPSPQPTRPLPLLAEWGWRCSGSRARDPARARSRAVSYCPARAASRSPSVSGAEGSVKRRRRFLFPFLPLPSAGSSILHPATPPTPQRAAAAAEGCGGGGNWGPRRPLLLSPRVAAFAERVPMNLMVFSFKIQCSIYRLY